MFLAVEPTTSPPQQVLWLFPKVKHTKKKQHILKYKTDVHYVCRLHFHIPLCTFFLLTAAKQRSVSLLSGDHRVSLSYSFR